MMAVAPGAQPRAPSRRRPPARAPAPDSGPRRARRPRRKALDPVEVLLLGSSAVADRVHAAIRRLGISVLRPADPKELLERLDVRTRLIVLVPPLPDLSAQHCCREIRSRAEGAVTPILVAATSPMTARQHRALYAAGASGHFEWPEEKTAFVRAVLRCAGSLGGRRPADARNAALSAKLEEQLRSLKHDTGGRLKISAQRGTVFLSGEVGALWKLAEARKVIMANPEVQDVVSEGVRVPPSGFSDRSLARAVNGMLKNAAGRDYQTLGLDVSGGHVTLSGTVRSRPDMERIVGLIEQVEGVRSIDNLMSISPQAQSRDRLSARRLGRALRNGFPRARVDVAVFDGVVVLRGRADGAAERRAIESLLLRQPGVERIVSKVV